MNSLTQQDAQSESSIKLLATALEYNRQDLVDILMGLDVVANDPGALQVAVKDGNEVLVTRILNSGGNIHHVDPENGSLLQIAAANDRENIVTLLFEKGYNPDELGCAIAPAITAAIRAKHNTVAQILLQKRQKK